MNSPFIHSPLKLKKIISASSRTVQTTKPLAPVPCTWASPLSPSPHSSTLSRASDWEKVKQRSANTLLSPSFKVGHVAPSPEAKSPVLLDLSSPSDSPEKTQRVHAFLKAVSIDQMNRFYAWLQDNMLSISTALIKAYQSQSPLTSAQKPRIMSFGELNDVRLQDMHQRVFFKARKIINWFDLFPEFSSTLFPLAYALMEVFFTPGIIDFRSPDSSVSLSDSPASGSASESMSRSRSTVSLSGTRKMGLDDLLNVFQFFGLIAIINKPNVISTRYSTSTPTIGLLCVARLNSPRDLLDLLSTLEANKVGLVELIHAVNKTFLHLILEQFKKFQSDLNPQEARSFYPKFAQCWDWLVQPDHLKRIHRSMAKISESTCSNVWNSLLKLMNDTQLFQTLIRYNSLTAAVQTLNLVFENVPDHFYWPENKPSNKKNKLGSAISLYQNVVYLSIRFGQVDALRMLDSQCPHSKWIRPIEWKDAYSPYLYLANVLNQLLNPNPDKTVSAVDTPVWEPCRDTPAIEEATEERCDSSDIPGWMIRRFEMIWSELAMLKIPFWTNTMSISSLLFPKTLHSSLVHVDTQTMRYFLPEVRNVIYSELTRSASATPTHLSTIKRLQNSTRLLPSFSTDGMELLKRILRQIDPSDTSFLSLFVTSSRPTNVESLTLYNGLCVDSLLHRIFQSGDIEIVQLAVQATPESALAAQLTIQNSWKKIPEDYLIDVHSHPPHFLVQYLTSWPHRLIFLLKRALFHCDETQIRTLMKLSSDQSQLETELIRHLKDMSFTAACVRHINRVEPNLMDISIELGMSNFIFSVLNASKHSTDPDLAVSLFPRYFSQALRYGQPSIAQGLLDYYREYPTNLIQALCFSVPTSAGPKAPLIYAIEQKFDGLIEAMAKHAHVDWLKPIMTDSASRSTLLSYRNSDDKGIIALLNRHCLQPHWGKVHACLLECTWPILNDCFTKNFSTFRLEESAPTQEYKFEMESTFPIQRYLAPYSRFNALLRFSECQPLLNVKHTFFKGQSIFHWVAQQPYTRYESVLVLKQLAKHGVISSAPNDTCLAGHHPILYAMAHDHTRELATRWLQDDYGCFMTTISKESKEESECM